MSPCIYDVVIVGAGSSGLAVAKALQFHSLSVLILESGDSAGHSWKERYQFTSMTSPKSYLQLPGQDVPTEWPDFPSFAEYAEYLNAYARNFNVQYGSTVTQASFDRSSQVWTIRVERTDAPNVLQARHVVVASGWYTPSNGSTSSFDTKDFNRPIYEANQVPEPSTLAGQSVFIVGMGNTGADVGMALVKAGAQVTYGIRSIPTISSVKVAGARLHDVAKHVLDHFPPVFKDIACTVAMFYAFRGPFQKYFPDSLRGSRWLPTHMNRLPTLDFSDRSLAKAIKKKQVDVIRGPASFGPEGVVYGLDEGVTRQVDAVVMAIGFEPKLPAWLDQTGGEENCHFVGQRSVVSNPINCSIKEAQEVAQMIIGQPKRVAFAAGLLALFCAANFIEILSGSATVPALGTIAGELHINASESQWVLSAYNLTFAAFMLLAGRLSDVFSAKHVFLVGFTVAGVFSLGAGFCNSDIPLYITRAFQGMGASMAIPSAIRLICELYPDEKEQGLALQLFATAGAVSNIIGFLIGGILTERSSWRWTMWIIAVTSLPVALIGLFIIPSNLSKPAKRDDPLRKRLASVDLIGSLLIACFLILFVYALTAGNIVGWKTGQVIGPLVVCLSVVLPLFFIFEEYGRSRRGLDAALPNKVWGFPNFGLLFFVSVAAFYFYGCLFIAFSTLWSEPGYALSPYEQAKHLLPAGIATLIIAAVSEPLLLAVGPRIFLTAAMAVYAGGGALLANVNDISLQYWRMALPGMVLGSFGAGAMYICCSKMLVQTGPGSMSGVLGATFNSALQTGYVLAIGISLALIGQIGGSGGYDGYRAAFYALTVIGGVGAILCAVFTKNKILATSSSNSEISPSEETLAGGTDEKTAPSSASSRSRAEHAV